MFVGFWLANISSQLGRSGKRKDSLYLSRKKDTSVKKYSSKSKKVAALKCTQSKK